MSNYDGDLIRSLMWAVDRIMAPGCPRNGETGISPSDDHGGPISQPGATACQIATEFDRVHGAAVEREREASANQCAEPCDYAESED